MIHGNHIVGVNVGSRPNFRGRLIGEILERLIDHGRPIVGKLKEKYIEKNRVKIGQEMAELWVNGLVNKCNG